MKLLLRSKLAALVLVISLVTVITGVALASSSSSPQNQVLTSSVISITPLPLEVPEGGRLDVLGAGFTPLELVLIEIFTGEGETVVIDGGRANQAGAFRASISELPSSVGAGLYTINARTVGSTHVASAPLEVCVGSQGKC